MRRKTENIRIKLSPAQKEAIYAQPLSRQFRIVHIDSERGYAVYQHVLVDDTAKDYKQVFAVAKAYARECDCCINPVIHKNAPKARQNIYPGINDNANPDLTTEGYGYVDVKSPLNKDNIVKNANKACKQGAIAVITDLLIEETMTLGKAISISHDIFSEHNGDADGRLNYTKDQIHWFIQGYLYKLNRPEKK